MPKTAAEEEQAIEETLRGWLTSHGPRVVLLSLERACVDLRATRLHLDDRSSANYWGRLADRIRKIEA